MGELGPRAVCASDRSGLPPGLAGLSSPPDTRDPHLQAAELPSCNNQPSLNLEEDAIKQGLAAY